MKLTKGPQPGKRPTTYAAAILNLLLVSCVLGGSIAGADADTNKASDTWGWCHVEGYTSSGKKVEMDGPKMSGRKWMEMRTKARQMCEKKGLKRCKITWCRTESHP